MEKGIRPKIVSQPVLELIGYSLHAIQYGFIILTVQDGCVIRMERTEKFIFAAKNRSSYIKRNIPPEKHVFESKILQELQSLQYGQLVIRLEDGKVEQIEKTEKRRINEYLGHGDGI